LLIVDYNGSINSSYERAKSLKSDGAKLQGLRLFLTMSASYEVLYLLRIIKSSGGITMLTFIIGTMTGSIAMLFVMSLMVAAKQGDQRMEMMYKE
jgi:hypothetical protein